MKCLACDCILSDREATRRSTETGEFVDLCDDCLVDTEINYVDNMVLSNTIDEDWSDDEYPTNYLHPDGGDVR